MVSQSPADEWPWGHPLKGVSRKKTPPRKKKEVKRGQIFEFDNLAVNRDILSIY
jgi:hypothetical protein